MAGFDLSFSKILSDCCLVARPLIVTADRVSFPCGCCSCTSLIESLSGLSSILYPRLDFRRKRATFCSVLTSMWHQANALGPILLRPDCPSSPEDQSPQPTGRRIAGPADGPGFCSSSKATSKLDLSQYNPDDNRPCPAPLPDQHAMGNSKSPG